MEEQSAEKKAKVDAFCSEAMRDVVALEAAAGSGGSSSSSSSIWVSAVAVMHIHNNWLRCSVCSLNLLNFKPPVFQCKSGHLACESCRAGWCRKCKHGGARFDSQNTVAEHIISASKFKCPHSGCHSFFTYSEVTAHSDACPHAPSSCAEPGCGFASPPHALLRHLTSQHSWPAHGIQYGKALWFRVPASGRRSQLILAEDDGRVFALVVDPLGAVTVVSLVCVRAGASPRPWYKARLRAYGPRPSSVVAGSTSTVAMEMMTSSSRPGEVVVENLPCILTVPPTYLITGDAASKEVSLKIRVEIFCSDNYSL